MKKEVSTSKNIKKLLAVIAVLLVHSSHGLFLSSHNIILILSMIWLMLSWGHYQGQRISKTNVFIRMGIVGVLLVALYALVDVQVLDSVHRVGNFTISPLNWVLRMQLSLAFGYYLVGSEGWLFAPGGLFYRRS